MKRTKNWQVIANNLFLRDTSTSVLDMENIIHVVQVTDRGELYLEKTSHNFDFDFKLYGLEKPFIERVKKTYKNTKGNLGILLNGIQGTGKTVTGKILANDLNLPIIIVPMAYNGLNNFLSQIEQDVVIFIDEYEKIFKGNMGDGWDANDDNDQKKGDDSLLSLMDGVFTTSYRKVFILTTNELWISKNMRNRTGRVRYLKEFADLNRAQIQEIIDDCLVHKKFEEDIFNYLKNLEMITVDIVKGIVSEVNIFEETPEICCKDFNVTMRDDKYNVIKIPKTSKGKEVILISDVTTPVINNFQTRAKSNWQTAILYGEEISLRMGGPGKNNGIYSVYDANYASVDPKNHFKIRIEKVKSYHSSLAF